MKTKFLVFLISLFFLASFNFAQAQEVELPSPGLTPDSLFYFLEIIAEEIGTFFTFGDLKKAERHATLAAERLVEARAVVEKGKPEFVEKTLERYEMQLNKSMARVEKAESKGENTEKVIEVLAKVGRATSKHLEVLAEVYEKVPEEAKPAVENAMKASVKRHEKAVEALKVKDALGEVPEVVSLPEKVPAEVRERIQEKVRQESEIEKILEGFKSLGTVRAFCIEQGGPPEACERFPLEGYESFEPLEAFCTEMGGPSEICASIEAECREFGVTTPDECFIIFFTATTNVAPVSEEKMEELRIREETQEELRIQREAEEAEAVLRKQAAEERMEELQHQGEYVPVGPPEEDAE